MTLSEPTRQMANLWGRAVGKLNQKIRDIELNVDEAGTVSIDINRDSTNIQEIPPNSRIWINVINRLRIQRFDCGTLLAPHDEPKDTVTGSALLTAFGENYGEARWSAKFVAAEGGGGVWAWTDPTKIDPGPVVLTGDDGSGILYMGMDENRTLGPAAWGMDFDDLNPKILVNEDLPELYEKLQGKNETSLLVMPEVLGAVLDELIKSHCRTAISHSSEGWEGRWLTWAEARTEIRMPEGTPENGDELLRCLEWKEGVLRELKSTLQQASSLRVQIDGGAE